MSWHAIYDVATGALREIVENIDGVDMAGAGSVAIDALPDAVRCWDADSRAMVDDLAGAKVIAWAAVKAKRDGLIKSGVAVAGVGTFDSDLESRVNVIGAALTALIMDYKNISGFMANFTLADNSPADLDADQMMMSQVGGVQTINAIYARGAVLRDQIDAAADVAALDAIDISAGWPEEAP